MKVGGHLRIGISIYRLVSSGRLRLTGGAGGKGKVDKLGKFPVGVLLVHFDGGIEEMRLVARSFRRPVIRPYSHRQGKVIWLQSRMSS